MIDELNRVIVQIRIKDATHGSQEKDNDTETKKLVQLGNQGNKASTFLICKKVKCDKRKQMEARSLQTMDKNPGHYKSIKSVSYACTHFSYDHVDTDNGKRPHL